VANRPSRPHTTADDADLTPPEERRARRLRLFLFLAIVVIAALAIALYFGARPVGGAIKAWQSRRLARQAFALIDQKQWGEANARARDAYLLRPTEPEAWRAIARLFSRTGQSTKALEWWKKVDEEHRLTIEDRRDFAGAALVASELVTGAAQVDSLLAQQGGPAPIDILLAGQLAVRRNDAVLAVDYAERALADKRVKPYDILSAAILVLSITTHDSQHYISAWKRIEDLARDPKNTASLEALVFLTREQSRAPSPSTTGNTPFALGSASVAQPTSGARSAGILSLGLGASPPPPVAKMGPIELANALENHPDGRSYHKLLALQLRVEHDPALTDEYIGQAVERFGSGDDETLSALTAWLNRLGRSAKTLELLPVDRASRRQDLFLQHINALASLERWNELKDELTSERFPVDPVWQHMYLATARTHLGEATAANNEWQRALEVANTPEKLLALADYAEQNNASEVAASAYSEATKLAPKNRAAYAGRLRVAMASGHTAAAQAVAAEIVQLWPDDTAARNQDDYLRLLLGASGGTAEAAERQAQVLVAREPSNWSARATLGLARLRLGRKEDALKAFRSVRATGSEPPGALAVRAAILAVNGYEEGAKGDAHNLGAAQLLPEERALIAPLLVERQEKARQD
jgi:Flp pilus assembly protein TadD/nitrate reductase NapE component